MELEQDGSYSTLGGAAKQCHFGGGRSGGYFWEVAEREAEDWWLSTGCHGQNCVRYGQPLKDEASESDVCSEVGSRETKYYI